MPRAALSDLEFAAAKLPNSALVLDRLGQTYILLDRPADAARVLRRAAALAPNDAKTQLHAANALTQAGETTESRTFMNRYRELGGTAAVPARGVMDYLNLTPEQQRAAYRARIEKALADHPEDAAMQVAFLKLSIADGQIDQAVVTLKKLATMKPGAILSADAGRAMLAAQQYPAAKELLNQAATADPAADLDFDLAQAIFHTDGARAGIQRLDRIPASQRGGDYYVARARMLDASGKTDEAMGCRENGAESGTAAGRFVLASRGADGEESPYQHDALALLVAATAPPDDAQILTIRAVVLDAKRENRGSSATIEPMRNTAGRKLQRSGSHEGTIQAAHGKAAKRARRWKQPRRSARAARKLFVP